MSWVIYDLWSRACNLCFFLEDLNMVAVLNISSRMAGEVVPIANPAGCWGDLYFTEDWK